MKYGLQSFVRPAMGLLQILRSISLHSGCKENKCVVHFMLDPLWDFDKLSDQFYKYSGCKKNEMWGKNCYTSCGA
jgi:hypothetical protein